MKYKLDLQLFGGRGAAFYAKKDFSNFIEQGAKRGYTKPIDITKIEDQRLSVIENKIRTKQYEEGYIYNDDGTLIAGFIGDSKSVDFDIRKITKGTFLTHNHPTGMSNYGATFSFADVQVLNRTDASSIRAVSSGQGEFNYIMKKGANANAKGFNDRISRDMEKIEKNFTNEYKKAYNDNLKQGKTKKQALHIARQKGTGVVDRYWKNTAPIYGYEYIVKNKKYDY